MNIILEFLRSKQSAAIIAVLFALALIVGVFSAGIAVGYRKARFSYAWGENYDRNFGGPRHGIFGMREGAQFTDAHGTFGQIIQIDPRSSSRLDTIRITIKGRDNIEKILLVDHATSIQRMRVAVQPEDLAVDDSIIAIGEPNEFGQIVAKFIRVMPPMPILWP